MPSTSIRNYDLRAEGIRSQFDLTAFIMAGFASLAYNRPQRVYEEVGEMLGVLITENKDRSTRPIVNYWRTVSDFQPAIFKFDAPNLQIFAIEGTTNQWPWYPVSFLNHDGLWSLGSPEFRMSSYYKYYAQFAKDWVEQRYDLSKPCVFVGHSLGGILAQIVAISLKLSGFNPRAVFTFGAPKGIHRSSHSAVTVPIYRFEAEGDPIPSLPWKNYLYAGLSFYDESFADAQLEHFGSRIELPRLDEDGFHRERNRRSLASICRINPEWEQHKMSQYVESTYDRMTPQLRAYARPLARALAVAGASTVPNAPEFVGEEPLPSPMPLPRPTLQEVMRTVDRAARAERAYLQGLLDSRAFTVRLYANRDQAKEVLSAGDFTEIFYPGYEAQQIPANMAVVNCDRDRTYSDDGKLTFRLDESQPFPVVLEGFYVTMQTPDGEKLVGYEDAPPGLTFQDAGDAISLRVSFIAAEIELPAGSDQE